MSTPGIASQARADILDALKAAAPGVPVLDTMPPTLYPPCLILTEADPFITTGNTLAALDVHFEAIALVAPSSDETVMLADLDALVSPLVEGLTPGYLDTVSGYQTFTFANQQPIYGARLTLASTGWTIGKD